MADVQCVESDFGIRPSTGLQIS